MTSKQLINHLCYEYNTINYDEEKLKRIQEIKKDLEVLEILKKYISVDIEYNQYWLKIYNIGGIAISEEEYNKLKEWIENE